MKVAAMVLVASAILVPEGVHGQSCSPTYAFSNGSTADANQVNSNFNSIANCVSGGTVAGSSISLSTAQNANHPLYNIATNSYNTAGNNVDVAWAVSNGSYLARYGIWGHLATTYNALASDTAYVYSSSPSGIELLSDSLGSTIRSNIGSTTVTTVSSSGLSVSDGSHYTVAVAGGGAGIANLGGTAGTTVTNLQTNGATVISLSTGGAMVTGSLIVNSGSVANQLRTSQTTAPVCGSNCGTSPGVVGSDTAMVVTLGNSPSTNFVISFNGTWPAASPACVGQAAKSGMTATPLLVVASTTSLTVTTSAPPATGDKYVFHCVGVS